MATEATHDNGELVKADHSVPAPATGSRNGTGATKLHPVSQMEQGAARVAPVPEMESAPTKVTEIIRAVIRTDLRNLAALSHATGIPKPTLSRFMNRKGSLQSDKLDALAGALDLTLVRHISLADHIDQLMKSKVDFAWFGVVCDRVGVSPKEAVRFRRFPQSSKTDAEIRQEWNAIHDDTAARAEWEAEFRARLTEQERERLQAISWIILDDDMPTEPPAARTAR